MDFVCFFYPHRENNCYIKFKESYTDSNYNALSQHIYQRPNIAVFSFCFCKKESLSSYFFQHCIRLSIVRQLAEVWQSPNSFTQRANLFNNMFSFLLIILQDVITNITLFSFFWHRTSFIRRSFMYHGVLFAVAGKCNEIIALLQSVDFL